MAKQPRVWSGSQWEPLAVTLPDLSNYSTTTQMNTAIDNAKGLVYITQATGTSASSISVNNCFTSTYENYLVTIDITNTISFDLNLRFRASGSDNTTSNYSYANGYTTTTFTGARANNVATSILCPNTAQGSYSIALNVFKPQLAQKTTFSGIGGAEQIGNTSTGSFNLTTQFDGFTIYPASSTITGTIRVYGYRNS